MSWVKRNGQDLSWIVLNWIFFDLCKMCKKKLSQNVTSWTECFSVLLFIILKISHIKRELLSNHLIRFAVKTHKRRISSCTFCLSKSLAFTNLGRFWFLEIVYCRFWQYSSIFAILGKTFPERFWSQSIWRLLPIIHQVKYAWHLLPLYFRPSLKKISNEDEILTLLFFFSQVNNKLKHAQSPVWQYCCLELLSCHSPRQHF